MTLFKWLKIWFIIRREIKNLSFDDELRILKLLKVGLRVIEKESQRPPGKEITERTFISLKIINLIDKYKKNEDRIYIIRDLLRLNKLLGKK